MRSALVKRLWDLQCSRASLAFFLVLALPLIWGCSKEKRIVTGGKGSFPETQLTFTPLEYDSTSFRVHLYWNGSDNDGEVVRFHFATDADTIHPINQWSSTTATDTILLFAVDPVQQVQ